MVNNSREIQAFCNELFEFIAENSEAESSFLTPYPVYSVSTQDLLDKIAELRGISKEENGREYNEVADKVDNKNSDTE